MIQMKKTPAALMSGIIIGIGIVVLFGRYVYNIEAICKTMAGY